MSKKIGEGRFEDGTKANAFLFEDGSVGLTDAPSFDSPTGRFLVVPKERIFTRKEDELFFNLFNRREWYLFLKKGIYYARYSQKWIKTSQGMKVRKR